MATFADLQQFRAALVAARASGLREVRDSSGEAVSYKSDREMASALAFLDREIAKLTGATGSRFHTFTYSRGLD